MAREIRNFVLTVPANTLVSAPVTLDMGMPARIVQRIRCRVPPGPAGTLGFRISSGGVAIIPWNANQWINTDNEILDFDLEGYPTSGAWQAQGYNTGVYQHTVRFTFYLDLPQLAARGAVLTQPLDLGA